MSEDFSVAENPQNLSESLQVEGEPGVYWCARHRKVKTRLRCGRCDAPICPKCTNYGPTGVRCKTCLSNRGSHLYQVTPLGYALSAIVALVLGVVLAFIASVAGFFALFYAPLAGIVMGRAIAFVSKNKRGSALAFIGVAGLVLGTIIVAWPLLMLLFSAHFNNFGGFTSLGFLGIYLALAIPGVWYWLK